MLVLNILNAPMVAYSNCSFLINSYHRALKKISVIFAGLIPIFPIGWPIALAKIIPIDPYIQFQYEFTNSSKAI